MNIHRDNPTHNKYVQGEADMIFTQILNKLPNYIPFKLKLTKKLALWHVMELEKRMTSVGCIVISKSPKKLGVMRRWYENIYDSIEEINGYTKNKE